MSKGPNFDTFRASADRVAPPSFPWLWLIVIAVIGAIGLSALFKAEFIVAILSIGGATWVYRQLQVKLSQYKSDFALYKELWVCRDCGHIYRPSKL